MSFPPEFYLIGAQKSGTTTLAHLLSQHSGICVAKSKEPHFFTTNWSKGLAWYQTEFSNHENAVCIDASTTYSMAPLSAQRNSRITKNYLQDVPQKIYSINPNAKFIYLLRNPISRTYSAYWHYVTNGREQREFGEAIRDDYFYLDVSDYYGQLTLWLRYFPIESFLFVLFEDMKKNPEQVAKECFRFIGLDSNDIHVHLEKPRNKSRYVNTVGRQFNSIFKNLDYSGLGCIAPSFIRAFADKLTTDYDRAIPEIHEKDQAFLRQYFSEKNSNLELQTGLSLKQWQA